jgi:hypothetical protein
MTRWFADSDPGCVNGIFVSSSPFANILNQLIEFLRGGLCVWSLLLVCITGDHTIAWSMNLIFLNEK